MALLGPFKNTSSEDGLSPCKGFDADFLESVGGEAGVHPSAGERMIDTSPLDSEWISNGMAEKVWQETTLKENRINLIEYFKPNENTVAYAYCEFFSPRKESAVLKLGSDDGIKAWLNGSLILQHHIHRALNDDDDIIPIEISRGKNRILLKIDQGNSDWGFSVKLSDLESEKEIWNTQAHHKLQIIENGDNKSFSGNLTCIVLCQTRI